jgi:glutathione peroxidase
MKKIIALVLAAALTPVALCAKPKKAAMTLPATATAYDFTLTAIDGTAMPLKNYQGRAILLVNTASFCGYTPQYDGLQKLFSTYEAKGLTVIGVPSGDFGGQELSKNSEIKEFCSAKFNIRFPMAEKAVVKGDGAIPIFKWAAEATASPPKWNFHKYLIGRDGKAIAAFGSGVKPDAAELKTAIETALAAKG